MLDGLRKASRSSGGIGRDAGSGSKAPLRNSWMQHGSERGQELNKATTDHQR